MYVDYSEAPPKGNEWPYHLPSNVLFVALP
jgi:hypothetical protein